MRVKNERLVKMVEMLQAGFCGECTHALDTEFSGERAVDYCWFCEHSVEEDGTTTEMLMRLRTWQWF